ncbi:STAS domain-containing protein [Streptomyces sp. JB150]|uniref:STAS domain-containing protein n=1 Tax=Streptomyces sp. JB150 TaxID=2714844 RepID=UPI0014094F8B|nr:STAS domain-containing protein [Streptomyces sp. JB150]QIJ66022.1 STAS domain-containing protein [Streptomyces sp. JB150]
MSERRPGDGNTERASDGRAATLRTHVRPLAEDGHLVTVTGDLDLHTAPRLAGTLQPLLADDDGRTVLADLSGVTFLDSAGLTCLIAAYRTARNTGARLALIAPSRPVLDLLRLTGVDRVLDSYPSPEAAFGERPR